VELAWRWNTDLSAPISLDGGIDWGGFLSGRRHDVFGTLNARKGASDSGWRIRLRPACISSR
jgi:hypothetical protein